VTLTQETLDYLAEVIRHSYPFEWVHTPRPLPAVHQRRHRKLAVDTDQGTFLAKTYKRDPHILDALRFQHRLSDHLDRNGLPVARIQAARDGRRIVEVETWALELQEFVHGGPMEISSETLAIAGDALGRFHEVCRDFPRPARDAIMWRFSEVPRDSFANLFERAKAEGDPAKAVEYCNCVALVLHEAAQELSFEKRNLFESGLIHGDWHSGNLVFREGRLAALVDLEFAGDGCFLEDLAYAISNLCIRTTMRPERLLKRTERFLTHYQRHRTLSFYEEAALYYAVGIKHVTTVSYQLPELGGKVAGLTAAEWMEHLAAQCHWLAEAAKRVRAGLR